jgi:hypothetical protein
MAVNTATACLSDCLAGVQLIQRGRRRSQVTEPVIQWVVVNVVDDARHLTKSQKPDKPMLKPSLRFAAMANGSDRVAALVSLPSVTIDLFTKAFINPIFAWLQAISPGTTAASCWHCIALVRFPFSNQSFFFVEDLKKDYISP